MMRTINNLTQNEMADKLGISSNYLSLIESHNKVPSAKKIALFAKSLNISKEALTFIASEVPNELGEEDKKKFNKLQNNILSLLLFELNGEFKKVEQ